MENFFNKLSKPVRFLLLFLIIPFGLFAQDISVSGTVTDNNGEALIGVSVVQKGTTKGISTDIDGKYTLTVPRDAVLDFSYIGYLTQSVSVQGRNRIDVVLVEDAKALEEVVVIGYGTQRREAVTGSVASMSGAKLADVQTGNITSALQGRLAGIDLAQTSSKPGTSMQIRIRGTRSLNASNDPLIVLDGIPYPGQLSEIDPNSIKSIDVLKDASSTAIYGSRGANGVIMITTHKGVAGTAAKVSYSGYYGAKTLFAPYPMMDGPEFVKLRQTADKWPNGIDEADDVNIDWQDLMYRTGIITNHDVTVLGGTEKGSYNFGLGYFKEEAILPGQAFDRMSLRGSIDQELGKYIRLGITTNNNYSVNEGNNLGIYTTLSNTPIANPWNTDGTWKRNVQMSADSQLAISRDYVESLGDSWIDLGRSFGSYNNIFGEVKIPGVDGLKYRLNLGLNFRMSNTGSYTGEGVLNNSAINLSSASISNSLQTNWAVENLLTYDKEFGKHKINVVGMYSAEQTTYNRSSASARDIPADHFQFYNLGRADGEISINPANQSYEQYGLISYMGRVMYSYNSRYMLSLTARADASSRLAPGRKWHTYPAVSAGWNISEESFMEGLDEVVNQLKLRVGYGETSNQAVPPYKTLGLLNTRAYNFGDEYATGYYVSELPNKNLGWEYSTTWNYGLDFSLLNNRLSGTFEYYLQNTHDVLFNVNLPATSGVGSYWANVAQTQNKGFELTLNGTIIDNKNGWTWDAGVNLYVNRNKIVSLASGYTRDEGNWWFVGHPIDVIFDYEKIGLWQEEDPYRDILEPGGNVGMIKVKYTGEYYKEGDNIPANRQVGDPVRAIAEADRQIIDLEPNFLGGFNTRIGYKGVDLTIVGAFRNGGKLISSLYGISGQLNYLTGKRGNVKVDYWTPENTGAKYPKPGGVESASSPKYGNSLALFDGSYLKVRTITLGYTLPASLLKSAGISSCKIYGSVVNPFVLFSPYAKESGMDPETNSYGNENQAISDQWAKNRLLIIGVNTPSTRNFLFGLNLTF